MTAKLKKKRFAKTVLKGCFIYSLILAKETQMILINRALVLICCVVLQLSTAVMISPIWLSPLNATNGPQSSVPRGEWVNSTVGVGARTGNFVVQVDSKGKIWILGGYSDKFIANAVWNYDPKTDLYRWVSGSADSNIEQTSIESEFGVPNATAFPGAVNLGAYAIDHYDNIWIYGGSSHYSNQNMFWRFNTTSFEFTNFRVNDTRDPVFGELGVPSADNYPGSLEGASLLVDSHNNLWLLGGYRHFAVNEVWHFNTTSYMWTLKWGQVNTEIIIDFKNKTWNGRASAAAIIDGEDRIWMYGGSGWDTVLYSQSGWGDMWSFDTKTLTWRVEWGDETSFRMTSSLVVLDDYDINNHPGARDIGAGMVDRQDGTLLVGGGLGAGFTNDYWLFNKTSKLWKFVYGSLDRTDSAIMLPTQFTHYRTPGSYFGFRLNAAVSGGIHNRGHLIVCGGDDDENFFSDIWIFPQDQCVANNDCDVNAVCTVSSDDYFLHTCTCNEGYVGDGKSCTLSPVSSPSDSSNNPSSNVTPNNNNNPSKSPSSKVSDAGVMTSGLFVYLLTLTLF